ncbi:MAG: DNA pilot protein [Microvirus sp.]|nr:MAG: DNA pilot protein [Microvirus sp.]
MPTSPENVAAWNTAGQLATTAINSMAQNNLNRKTMKYNDEWAYRQREWALQDWQAQNEYNLPANQRKRMIEANMNPALMYGSGATTQPSATVKGTSSPSWSPKAPEVNFNPASSIMSFLGVRMQEAQLKNMEIQNRLLEEKITNTQANTELTWNKAALTDQENEKLRLWLQGVYDYNSGANYPNGKPKNYFEEKNVLDITNARQKFDYSWDENQRREVLNAANVDVLVSRLGEIAQRNATSKAQEDQIRENILLLQKSGILKQFQINGEEFLNQKFSGPAAKLLLGLLQRADVIR